MSNDRPDYRGNPLDFIGTLADVAGGLGEWIANGTPDPNSIPGEIQQRYRDHCDSWSNGPTWVQQFDPGARLFLSNACKPWLDSQGSGDPGFEIVPPGTLENVGDKFDGRPFGGFKVGNLANPCIVEIELDELEVSTGSNRYRRVFCDGSEGFIVSPPEFAVPLPGSWGCCNTPNPEPPPGPTKRPTPNPNPRPDPGLDPDDEPFVDPTGQPRLPMPTVPGPLDEPVQLPNFPLPNVDGPSLFPEDEPPLAEPGEPGTPETVAGDDEAEGDADEGEILTGVKVEVDSAPSFARQVQNVSTPTYIGAAYVYLGWEDQLDLQPEGQFLVDGQFFAAVPGMTHWRVRSAVGYTLTVTPFYAPSE